MKVIRCVMGTILSLAMVLSSPTDATAKDRLSLSCDVNPAAGRNRTKVPKWLELEVDFYSGRAKVTAPGIGGEGRVESNGKLLRDTDRLFSVEWRSLVELGYYTKTTIKSQRVSVMKADLTGRYRSDRVRDRGNLSGTVRCRER